MVSFPARMDLEPIALPDSIELDFRLVHSAQQPTDSDETGASRVLDWKLLKILYGSSEIVRSRVERLCDRFVDREWSNHLGDWGISAESARETITLAKAYLGGEGKHDHG